MNGNTRTIADAWFDYSQSNTISDSQYTGSDNVSDDAVVLPNERGYGLLPDLHVAMTNDSTLLSMVQDVASQTLSDLFDPTYDVGSRMLAIAYQWAGVESVSPTSRGGYFDGQKLGFLEHLYDFTYWGAVGSSPGPNSQTYLDQAWPLVFGAISANFLGQTALGDLFGHPGYSLAGDELSGGTWNADSVMQFASLGVGIGVGHVLHDTGVNDIYVFQPGDSPISGSYYQISEPVNSDTNMLLLGGVDPTDVKIWDDSTGNLWVKYSSTDQVEIDGSHAIGGECLGWEHVQEIAFSNDGTIWDLTNGLNLTALSNSQTLYGTTYADTLTATGNYDILYGYAGNDTLVAAPGGALHGGAGGDTYVFSAGAASTTYGGAHIYENSSEGTDTIAFTGITPANVQMWTNTSGELIIQYASGDQAIVEGGSYNSSTGFTVGNVESVTFDDTGHTTWDLTGGLHLVNDNTGRSLFGTSSADTIEGGTGNDNIYGYGGGDTLYGGGGSDFLQGGSGADTYVFKSATAFGGSFETISGFSTSDSDVIDIRDVLAGHYNPSTDNIANFVSFSNFFGSTLIYIDQDGPGSTYSSELVGELYSVTGVTVSSLISNGELLVS